MHHKKRGANEQAFAWNTDSDTVASIETVENGARCGCVCLSCGQPMEAKQGGQNAWHFAHQHNKGCKATAETALHLTAKKIVEREKRMALPPIPTDWLNPIHPLSPRASDWNESRIALFGEVLLEERCEKLAHPPKTFIPDATGVEAEGEALFIEVRLTHAVDQEKRNKISQHGRPALEIDLSRCDRGMSDLEELTRLVLDDTENKTWLLPALTARPRATESACPTSPSRPTTPGGNFTERIYYLGNMPVSVRIYPWFLTIQFPYHEHLNQGIRALDGKFDHERY